MPLQPQCLSLWRHSSDCNHLFLLPLPSLHQTTNQQTTRAKAELLASLGAQNDARDLPLLLSACRETETPEGAANNPNLLETNIVRSGRYLGTGAREGGREVGQILVHANTLTLRSPLLQAHCVVSPTCTPPQTPPAAAAAPALPLLTPTSTPACSTAGLKSPSSLSGLWPWKLLRARRPTSKTRARGNKQRGCWLSC